MARLHRVLASENFDFCLFDFCLNVGVFGSSSADLLAASRSLG